MAGLVIISLFVLAAILAPLITSHDPADGSLQDRRAPPSWQDGGTLTHPLGTDYLGRDVWSRLVYGARTTLIVALGALAVGGVSGTTLGFVLSHYRGLWYRIRGIFSAIHAIHSVMSFPLNVIPFTGYYLVALVFVAILGAGLTNLILVMGLVSCPRYILAILTEAMRLESSGSVTEANESAALGFETPAVRQSPKVVNTLVPLLVSQVGFLIIMESALTFLGVGVPPPTPSWGGMVSDSRAYLLAAWWVWTFPLVNIALLAAGFYLLGNWLRDRREVEIERPTF